MLILSDVEPLEPPTAQWVKVQVYIPYETRDQWIPDRRSVTTWNPRFVKSGSGDSLVSCWISSKTKFEASGMITDLQRPEERLEITRTSLSIPEINQN